MGLKRRVWMPEHIEYPKGKPPRVRLVVRDDLREAVGRITGKNRKVANLRRSLGTHDPAEIKRLKPIVEGELQKIIDAAEALTRRVPVRIPGRVPSWPELRSVLLMYPEGVSRDRIIAGYGNRVVELPPDHPGVIRDELTGEYVADVGGTRKELARAGQRPLGNLQSGADCAKPADAHVVVSPEDAIANWRRNRKDRSPGPKAIRNSERALRRFFDWLNECTPMSRQHRDMAMVLPSDVEDFKEALLTEAEENPGSAPDPYDTMVTLKAVFNALPRTKLPKGNPVEKVKNPPKRQKRERVAFTDAERAAMLDGSKGRSPVIRITTLIASHTGAHTAEIVEANTSDIEVRSDGITAFRIREEHRDENQNLKTRARVRTLPLHPRIAAEVVAYRDQIIAKYGPGPLFPMVRLDKDRRRNTYASREIMEWLRSDEGPNIQNGERVIRDFYSWRRTVRTILLDANVDPDRARYIVGHAAQDIDAKHYQEHPVKEVLKCILEINIPE